MFRFVPAKLVRLVHQTHTQHCPSSKVFPHCLSLCLEHNAPKLCVERGRVHTQQTQVTMCSNYSPLPSPTSDHQGQKQKCEPGTSNEAGTFSQTMCLVQLSFSELGNVGRCVKIITATCKDAQPEHDNSWFYCLSDSGGLNRGSFGSAQHKTSAALVYQPVSPPNEGSRTSVDEHRTVSRDAVVLAERVFNGSNYTLSVDKDRCH